DLYRSHTNFDRIMKQLSEEFGFLYVPPHAFEPELTDALRKGPNSNATYAAKRGADTRRPQWSRAQARLYGERLSDHIDRGTSWDDLDALFAEDGLTLEPKGKGWVAGDAASYVKLSALGLTKTAKGFEKRRSAKTKSRRKPTAQQGRRPPARRNVWTVDAIDIARAIGSKDDVRAALQEARGQRIARRAGKPLMVQLMEELKEALKSRTSLTPPAKRPSPRRSTSRPRPSHTRSGR
ncbi:MAG: hypothetical protein ABL904_12765, partial [Hyphomicrobiaceae bacterium]